MSQLAVNPDTGEAVQWDGTAWQPAQIAHNPQTGETRALVGDKWQFLTGTTKDGASTNDPATWERWTKEDGRSTGEQVARGVGLFGKGLNDAIGAAAAAPVEGVNWLMKQPGRAVEALTGANVPNVLPEAGFYTQKAQGALNALGRNDTPENTVEKAAYGAGQGVGNAASVMLPAAGVAGLARAGSATANVAGQLAAQPVTQALAGAAGGAVGEATDNPWLGAATSLAVPAGMALARGVVSPGGVRPSPEMRRLAAVAEAEGIPLTPGQITGSRPLRTVESVFGTLPSTAGKQAALDDAQRVAFNKAVLARAGETQAERATPDVIQGMLDRAGMTMQAVASRNTMTVDRAAMQSVQDVATEASKYLTREQKAPVLARVRDFIDSANWSNNTVDGKAFAKLDSALSTQIRNTTEGNARKSLSDLQSALRDAMNASMTGEDAALWAEARRQYANGKIIEAAMNKPNAQTAAGNIPPASLSQAVATGPGGRFARGKGDLNELARVGRAFIQEAVPNSGTPERLAIQNMLTGGALGGGALYGGASPVEALGLLAAASVGPKVAQSAYYTPAMRNYLTNQVADRIIPRPTAGLLGAAAAANVRPLMER